MIPRLLAALLLFLLIAGTASAVPDRHSGEQGEVRLISSVRAVGNESVLRLGLHFRMAGNWKVYWRSPGDAGYPPKPDWKGSANLAKAEILWPIPSRFSVSGLETIGYGGELVLPLAITPEKTGKPVSLRLALDFLACDAVCIPVNADLALDLPEGAAEAAPEAHLIERFAARVPGPRTAHGLGLERVRIMGGGKEAYLLIEAAALPSFRRPDIFIEGPEEFAFSAPKVELSNDGGKAVMRVAVEGGEKLAGRKLILTLADGERALEAAVSPQPGQEEGPFLLLIMLATAFLGGVILNLMPCVLPVLSIKIMGLIGHSGAERREIRLGFLASSGGIVASFLGLAVIAVILKSAGSAVGWGIQFQQPLFLSAMIVLLLVFAANLWGFFEFRLPHWMGGMGRGYGHPHSPLGHFLSGAFATLLATPCSAPFLGTAVGFALSRGTAEIMAIFLMLGLGMALPYLAVAAWPGLARRLPRPGRWMLVLKTILGFALAGTAVWLIFVLAATLLPGKTARETTTGKEGATLWQAFEPAGIPASVAAGKIVLVDVTADWCITCKVNKAVALDDAKVAARLKEAGIIAMRADWTRPDPAISAYLQSFGRYGIPFNAVYGPGAPDGLALPELLTPAIVLEHIERAAKK